MSRFHPNIVVSDVFGSAGDVTAHHRDGKTYLRKRSRPVHPMSEAQAAHLEVHLDLRTELVCVGLPRVLYPG